jgi:hypothetical protein
MGVVMRDESGIKKHNAIASQAKPSLCSILQRCFGALFKGCRRRYDGDTIGLVRKRDLGTV